VQALACVYVTPEQSEETTALVSALLRRQKEHMSRDGAVASSTFFRDVITQQDPWGIDSRMLLIYPKKGLNGYALRGVRGKGAFGDFYLGLVLV
jgi:hypothetical protein